MLRSLFDGTDGIEDIGEIYEMMEVNCPDPCSTSQKLWELRHAGHIDPGNSSPETLLEKAVAMLAENRHMHKWFNQCPTASGITDCSESRKRSAAVGKKGNIDLVHLSESGEHARLVELKWMSNDPPYALSQVLRYGAAYIFCRVHKKQLPLQGRPLMNVCHVALEVAAPWSFYSGYDERPRIARMRKSLDKFAGSKIHGLSMSLDALAFPADFQMPFGNGKQVKDRCDTHRLTAEGRQIRDAFNGLTPVWPAP